MPPVSRFVLALWLTLAAASVQAQSLNALSFNIRYHNPGDGEYAWPNRQEWVASILRFHQVDVAGLQEVLRGQLDDLTNMLPDYDWVGVGRDDGEAGGEFSPILYRRDRLALEDWGTFWLSATPEQVASVGWDAALPGIVTWAWFRDQETDSRFLHFNTHFDHRGQTARDNSAALIVQRLQELAGDESVLLTGDFNSAPDSKVYEILTAEFGDARQLSAVLPHGPKGTFGGFTVEENEESNRIDYLFLRPDAQVLRYGSLSDQWRGRYPSDHLQVFAEVLFD